MLETSAFIISVRWSIYIINSVDKTKFLYTTSPPTQHHSFFRNYPLHAWKRGLEDKDKGKWMICKYYSHSFNVFLLFLSSLPYYQAEYLIFRKWSFSIDVIWFWNLPWDLWDKENRTEPRNSTVKPRSYAWISISRTRPNMATITPKRGFSVVTVANFAAFALRNWMLKSKRKPVQG